VAPQRVSGMLVGNECLGGLSQLLDQPAAA
jgi:hypothetical protein